MYRTFYVPCEYSDEIERCYARWVDCVSLTQALRYVRENRFGFAIRAYYGEDESISAFIRVRVFF